MTWRIELEPGPDNKLIGQHRLYESDYPLGDPQDDAVVLEKLKALRKGTDTGVLPPVVRWVSPQRRYAILERPPQTIDVNYYGVRANKISSAKLQEKTISLPWTTYCIGFDAYMRPIDTYVFATNGPITSEYTQLFVLPLTNIYANGRFCLPSLAPEMYDIDKPLTMGEGINMAYGQVWMSNFNTDIIETVMNSYSVQKPAVLFPEDPEADYTRVSPTRLLTRWSKLSLEEVASIKDWPMPNTTNEYSLRALMNDAMNWENTSYNSGVLYNSIRGFFS